METPEFLVLLRLFLQEKEKNILNEIQVVLVPQAYFKWCHSSLNNFLIIRTIFQFVTDVEIIKYNSHCQQQK